MCEKSQKTLFSSAGNLKISHEYFPEICVVGKLPFYHVDFSCVLKFAAQEAWPTFFSTRHSLTRVTIKVSDFNAWSACENHWLFFRYFLTLCNSNVVVLLNNTPATRRRRHSFSREARSKKFVYLIMAKCRNLTSHQWQVFVLGSLSSAVYRSSPKGLAFYLH